MRKLFLRKKFIYLYRRYCIDREIAHQTNLPYLLEALKKNGLYVPLSGSQKKEIDDYYQTHLGHKIDYRWHEYYYSLSGHFSPQYIPWNIVYRDILDSLNVREMERAYLDKAYFGRLFPDILQPLCYLRNVNGVFYQSHADIPITREEAIDICSQLPATIVKPSGFSHGGKGVILCPSFEGQKEKVSQLFDTYNNKNFVVQEVIKQHSELAKLNSSSVNTLRIISLRRKQTIHILIASVRHGISGSITDNASGGGNFCKVHPDGKLDSIAYSYTDRHICTPDGYAYSDIVIPHFSEIIHQTKEMHQRLPYFKFIAWDWAVNEQGMPVFIEFNTVMPCLMIPQLTNGPLFGKQTSEILQNIHR